MVKVNVTASCIHWGCKKEGSSCPVARAIRKCLPNAWSVDVGDDELAVMSSGYTTWIKVPLPKKAREFIAAFDRGWEVRPFSFTLNVPKEFST